MLLNCLADCCLTAFSGIFILTAKHENIDFLPSLFWIIYGFEWKKLGSLCPDQDDSAEFGRTLPGLQPFAESVKQKNSKRELSLLEWIPWTVGHAGPIPTDSGASTPYWPVNRRPRYRHILPHSLVLFQPLFEKALVHWSFGTSHYPLLALCTDAFVKMVCTRRQGLTVG